MNDDNIKDVTQCEFECCGKAILFQIVNGLDRLLVLVLFFDYTTRLKRLLALFCSHVRYFRCFCFCSFTMIVIRSTKLVVWLVCKFD